MRNARAFISCGQKDDKEKTVGISVENYFKKRGFETYFAERVHSPDALTENIFKFLRQSEYFVFVDFKRDPINSKGYRGSLFVNQEIAIATFLKLQGMGFYEKGTMREGILGYHIHNARPFEDGREIIEILNAETKNWDIDSVNELKIRYDPESTGRDIRLNEPRGRLSDWYHLEIRNRDKSRHAFSCYGYVTKIKDLKRKRECEVPTRELIWSGTGDIVVNTMGGTKRELDAFYVIHGHNRIRFNQRPWTTTRPQYRLPDLPQGKYLVEYTVVSSTFETVSQTFILRFEGSTEDIEFGEERRPT